MKNQLYHISVKENFRYILYLVLVLFIVGCSEENHAPIAGGGPTPGQVSNIEIIPTPGGAHLVYTLPNDANLSYVEAIVNTPEGRNFTFKSSFHRDTISVEGLATANQQEVLLYSVSKDEKRSEPVSINIKPLTPPFQKVLETLTLSEGLGGVDVKYLNEGGAELAFYIGRVINGQFVEEDAFYSDRENGRIPFWGYEPTEQKFGVFVRDRWDHYSDTIYADITPTLEIMIDKSKFKAIRLNNDSEHRSVEKPEYLWDGSWSEDYANPYGNYKHACVTGDLLTGTPASLTIDMGQAVNISRVRINHYWQFSGAAPRKYELYGLIDYFENNIPVGMGAWHNWTLLAQFENLKPSTTGGTTADDEASWEGGDNAILTTPSEAVRYIRLKGVESWNGRLDIDVAEMTVYGQPFN